MAQQQRMKFIATWRRIDLFPVAALRLMEIRTSLCRPGHSRRYLTLGAIGEGKAPPSTRIIGILDVDSMAAHI